ncbi:MAG TPA: universal stress protein [Planctomycetota bacterium]|nr:universal stress protein [Planctomycetota bacterium]
MKNPERILVGLDLSPDGKRLSVGSACAMEEARALAREYGAEVVLLHSTHGDEFVDPLTAHASIVSLGGTPAGRAALDAACEGLKKAGVKARLELSEDRPLSAFVAFAQKGEVDLVVVGKRAESYQDGRHLGSFSIQLLRYCPGPVLVVPPRPGVDKGPVLAATDLSEVGAVATRAGAELARVRGVPLHVVHAYQLPFELIHAASREPREAHQAKLARLKDDAQAAIREGLGGAQADLHVACTTPTRAIEAAIELVQPSVLVMGTVSRSGVPGLLFGNTAERVLTRVDCAILAVKPADFVSPIE